MIGGFWEHLLCICIAVSEQSKDCLSHGLRVWGEEFRLFNTFGIVFPEPVSFGLLGGIVVGPHYGAM